jgi:hypothetical protein
MHRNNATFFILDVIEANRKNVLEIYGIAIRPPHTH